MFPYKTDSVLIQNRHYRLCAAGRHLRLMPTQTHNLDAILDLLDRFHQRASYGAVAELIDRPAHYLMNGRPRNPRHSWIVNQDTWLPTGYFKDQVHPDIISRERVLLSAEDLESWLQDPS